MKKNNINLTLFCTEIKPQKLVNLDQILQIYASQAVNCSLLSSRAGHSLIFSRFTLCSIFIHGSLSLYHSFCQFSGLLIAQSFPKRPVVRSWKRALKRLIAPKTNYGGLLCVYSVYVCMYTAELGISLFEIAQSLFALERTFILGAMALLEAKSGAL